MKKVLFLYKFLPQYRVDFFQKLKVSLREHDVDLQLIYGKLNSNDKLKKDDAIIDWAICIQNLTCVLGKTELIFQPVIKHLKNKDLVIVQPENKLLITFYLILARPFSKYKLGFWSHGKNMQKNVNSWENRIKMSYLSKCDWWFAYTHGVSKFLQEQKYPEKKITTVQNAIDTLTLQEEYAKISTAQADLLKFNLGITGSNTAIFCGGMYSEKRIDFILRSCLRIKESVPDFTMIFIGGGVESVKVQDAAIKHNWIHYLGPKFGKDRVPYFRISSIQLMPGAVGLGILDSFALQTPIVTTYGSFHGPEIDYLETGKNGVITNNNIEDYTRSIITILREDSYLELIKGCVNSATKYTMGNMVKNFTNGILECLVR